jgi:hypothetical protein
LHDLSFFAAIINLLAITPQLHRSSAAINPMAISWSQDCLFCTLLLLHLPLSPSSNIFEVASSKLRLFKSSPEIASP